MNIGNSMTKPFKDYFIEKYGKPLYKVPIDLALSCPNREQNNGEGCIYCAENGARARHLSRNLNLQEQVDSGIEFITRRYNATSPYILYFQAYTSTNADLATLKNYYETILKSAEFAVIIIATRSDCLSEEILDYLSELNQRYDLWVELGVQTSNNTTLDFIKRGHNFESVQMAVNKLSTRNIKTVAHIIIGLPNENSCDFRKTAQDIAKLPFTGIKLHNLLVLKNTPLAKLYAKNPFKTLNEYEYANAVKDFLQYIPNSWYLIRLTTDADENDIIAPKWWMKKGQFLEYFKSSSNNKNVHKVKTNDGSYTFYHPKYKQHFHSTTGALKESYDKFINPCELRKRLLTQDNIKILDIGFGLGYNAISAIKVALELNKPLSITTLEFDFKSIELATSIFDKNSLEYDILSSILKNSLWASSVEKQGKCSIRLIIGDARKSIKNLNETFDCVFMDGFSPDKNPDLWTYDFIKNIKSKLYKNGVIVTYSNAYPVRGAFIRNNFHIGNNLVDNKRNGGTIASFNIENIKIPISEKEYNIVCKSTAGVPYRDPNLNCSHKKILNYRKKLVQKLKKLGIPKWFVMNLSKKV